MSETPPTKWPLRPHMFERLQWSVLEIPLRSVGFPGVGQKRGSSALLLGLYTADARRACLLRCEIERCCAWAQAWVQPAYTYREIMIFVNTINNPSSNMSTGGCVYKFNWFNPSKAYEDITGEVFVKMCYKTTTMKNICKQSRPPKDHIHTNNSSFL